MLKVDGDPVGLTWRPYLIAEMACAHNGKKDQVFKLIDLAVNGGADAIQLQIFTIDEMIVSTHQAYPIVKDIEFTKDEWSEFIEYARKFDIDVIVFAYDNESLKFAIDQKVDAIKFNSSDLLNIDMLKTAARSNIPFLLHTGSSTMDEIANAIEYARKFDPGQMILMHGVQNFPTSIENANISRMQLLKENFKLPTGYDDHTEGETDIAKVIDLIAVGAGADVLEKHITLSRAEKGIDYVSALEADEFKAYIERIHLASKAIGFRKIMPLNESDHKYRNFQKKSVTAIRNLRSGHQISRDDFKFLRNKEVGISPLDSLKILGQTLNKDINKFDNITFKDVE